MYKTIERSRQPRGSADLNAQTSVSEVVNMQSGFGIPCSIAASTISCALIDIRHFQPRGGRVIHVNVWIECRVIVSRN
jgi:hypothetical protein